MSVEYNDPNEFIPESGPALYALISLLPKAHGIPQDDLEGVKTDEWDDDGETWHVKLNGAGETYYPVVSPFGDSYPDPSMVQMYAGTFLVMIDDEALFLAHPDHLEAYTDPGDHETSDIWERAAIYAVHDRLSDLGLDGEDIPPVEEFIDPDHRDHLEGGAA